MNITKYIAEQFIKPTGIRGIISTFIMNRINQAQYNSVMNNLNCSPYDISLKGYFQSRDEKEFNRNCIKNKQEKQQCYKNIRQLRLAEIP